MKNKYDNSKRCCGNCARLINKQEEYGFPVTYCSLTKKETFKNNRVGCLGWKKREL